MIDKCNINLHTSVKLCIVKSLPLQGGSGIFKVARERSAAPTGSSTYCNGYCLYLTIFSYIANINLGLYINMYENFIF